MSIEPPPDAFDRAGPAAARRLGPVLRRVAIAVLALFVALGVHWSLLLRGHAEQQANAEARVHQRSAQLAHALALQVGTLVTDIDYMVRTLADTRAAGSEREFLRTQRLVEAGLPLGALVQVAVADARGLVVHSNLRDDVGDPVSIGDRAHFVFHADAGEDRLFISEPVLGRVSGRWSVQFTRRIERDGVFDGVVVLSIAPEYLSSSFRDIFPDPGDTVLLAREDGVYLARSHRFDEIVGDRAGLTHAFMRAPNAREGLSRAASVVDGTDRFYAFHRVDGYPLVVSVGLDASAELDTVRDAIAASRVENAVATGVVLLAGVLLAWMFLLRERNSAALADSRERLELALAGGELGTWDLDVPSGNTRFDERWAAMLGYRLAELEESVATWENLVHPDDWPAVDAALARHLSGRAAHYESEHRMRHRDGRWIWVLDRGRVVERAADGSAIRMTGTHADITSRKLAEAAIAESRERLEKLVAEVPGVVYQFLMRPDGSTCFPYASPGIRAVYGVDAAQAAASAEKVFEIIHPDDFERVTASIRESAERLAPWRCEYRVRDADGSVRWLLGHSNPQRLASGATLWHGYIYDVTEQHLAAAELEVGRQRLMTLLERFPGGVLMEDARDVVVIANDTLCELFGLSLVGADLIGLGHAELVVRLGPERSGWLHEPESAARGEQRRTIEIAAGAGHALEVDWVPILREGERLGRVWLVRDISERKQREVALEKLAATDTLTGLPNRRSFLSRLSEAARDARHRAGAAGVVMMLDIDHFKRVNDTWGHAVGDEVLQHFAEVVRQSLRRGDAAGRLGGEEFAVLLPGTGAEDGRVLAERLRERIETQPAVTSVGEIAITVSIGVAALGKRAEQALELADGALYRAKSSGRNRVCVADATAVAQ
ncbi:diguanylate cyclase [Pseudazoarcus pumilus]|nr:diguanylate cyclase [Pseudazoarcus pumilus]